MKFFRKIIPVLFAFVFIFNGISNAFAETREQVFETFNKTAERAEDTLSRGEASNQSLGFLRSDLLHSP